MTGTLLSKDGEIQPLFHLLCHETKERDMPKRTPSCKRSGTNKSYRVYELGEISEQKDNVKLEIGAFCSIKDRKTRIIVLKESTNTRENIIK